LKVVGGRNVALLRAGLVDLAFRVIGRKCRDLTALNSKSLRRFFFLSADSIAVLLMPRRRSSLFKRTDVSCAFGLYEGFAILSDVGSVPLFCVL
jgi:hypothetical protein